MFELNWSFVMPWIRFRLLPTVWKWRKRINKWGENHLNQWLSKNDLKWSIERKTNYSKLTSRNDSRWSLFLSAILNKIAASWSACRGCFGLTYDNNSERSATPSWFLSISRLNSSCRWNVFFSIMYWRHLSSKSSATTFENSSIVKWSSPSSSNWRSKSSTKLNKLAALDSEMQKN